MEGNVVETILFNAEVDGVACVVVPVVEVILSKRGLHGLDGSSLSDINLEVFVKQTYFDGIESEAILNVLLELDRGSDEIVIHALASVRIIIGVISTIAKDISSLLGLHVIPAAAIFILVNDGEEVPVSLRDELLGVVGNPKIAINHIVGGNRYVVVGDSSDEGNNFPGVVVMRVSELIGESSLGGCFGNDLLVGMTYYIVTHIGIVEGTTIERSGRSTPS